MFCRYYLLRRWDDDRAIFIQRKIEKLKKLLVYAELNLIEVSAIGNGCDSDILFCLKTEATLAK
jgi:hypothetical protein